MHVFLVVLSLAFGTVAASAGQLAEPALRLPPDPAHARRVALTFDACGGRTDTRILDVLVENGIPATIFVTARWIRRNPQAMAVLKGRPDLFEIENHGRDHRPAVDRPMRVYGLKAAGSADAVRAEVEGGALAVTEADGRKPTWFRGATAKYTPSAMALIESMGLKVAGYSLNGDAGSLLGATSARRRIANARDGDVVIAHINQPRHAAGAGVAEGILDLKAAGAVFVRLDAVDGVK